MYMARAVFPDQENLDFMKVLPRECVAGASCPGGAPLGQRGGITPAFVFGPHSYLSDEQQNACLTDDGYYPSPVDSTVAIACPPTGSRYCGDWQLGYATTRTRALPTLIWSEVTYTDDSESELASAICTPDTGYFVHTDEDLFEVVMCPPGYYCPGWGAATTVQDNCPAQAGPRSGALARAPLRACT